MQNRPPRWSVAAGVAVRRRRLYCGSGRRLRALVGRHHFAAVYDSLPNAGRYSPRWFITTSRYFGRFLWISEVHVTCDVSRRSLGNGFALVWQAAGYPCRGLTFSSCDDAQRRVLDLVPAVPLG